MKTNYIRILSAIVISLFVVSATVRAIDEPIEAKVITKEEAAKKYPAPPRGYPLGIPYGSGTPGFFQSPYSSTKVYDCRTVPKGALVLDKYTNKLFVRP
jgi:hypothetical protein